MKTDRCSSVHPLKGIQCGLPARHTGRHQNGNNAQPWDDPERLTADEIEMLYGTVQPGQAGHV
jgi:hypothetical protein